MAGGRRRYDAEEQLDQDRDAPRATEPPREETAAEHVLAMQAGAGNQAVTRLLARQPARAPAKPRDPGAMTEDEIRAEIDTNFDQRERPGVSRARWNQMFERGMKLQEELEQRAVAEDQRVRVESAREFTKGRVREAAVVSRRFEDELRFAMDMLDSVAGRLTSYLGYYEEAYGSFTKVLAKAKKDAAAREARDEVLAGILLGTGLGVAAGAIFAGAQGLTRVVVEAGTEVLEAVGGKGFKSEPPDVFAPPANLDPKLRSVPAGERMMDAWRGLAQFNFTTHAYGQYQLALQQLSSDFERDPSEARVRDMYRLLAKGEMGVFTHRLDELHGSVVQFFDASRHPLLSRNALEIEQDLWVRWISALPDDQDIVANALDEDAIEDHLHSIGVLGDRSRLDLDFGSNTTQGDTNAAYKRAKRESGLLDQVGRYGVAGDDIGPQPGTVALRDDLYERLGKKPPAGLDTLHRSFPAVAWSDPVKSGQLVRVLGTSSKGLEVAPAKNADYEDVFI